MRLKDLSVNLIVENLIVELGYVDWNTQDSRLHKGQQIGYLWHVNIYIIYIAGHDTKDRSKQFVETTVSPIVCDQLQL